jgi:hypothetical protein
MDILFEILVEVFCGMLGMGILIFIGVIAVIAGFVMNILWLIIAGAVIIFIEILVLIFEKWFFEGRTFKGRAKRKS